MLYPIELQGHTCEDFTTIAMPRQLSGLPYSPSACMHPVYLSLLTPSPLVLFFEFPLPFTAREGEITRGWVNTFLYLIEESINPCRTLISMNRVVLVVVKLWDTFSALVPIHANQELTIYYRHWLIYYHCSTIRV